MIVFDARGRDGVDQLQFLPGNELAARTGDGVCVWDLATLTLRVDQRDQQVVRGALHQFAPDGRSIVASYGGAHGFRVCSLADGSWVDVPLQLYYSRFLLWSPDGQTLMTGDQTGNGRLADTFHSVTDWKPAPRFLTRQPVAAPGERLRYHSNASLSPDGRHAVTYSDGTLHLYDLFADKLIKEVALPFEHPKPGLFTPDGSLFLVWSRFKIYALDLDAGKVAVEYPACPRAVHGATLTPDGRHLLQVSADRTVRVLDVATGQLVKDYAWSAGKLAAVAVSPDGLLAACGGSGGKVVVWDLDL